MVAPYSVYISEKNYTISVINRTAGHESIVIYMCTYAYIHTYIYIYIYTIFFQIKTFCLMSMLVADCTCTSYLGTNSFFGEGAIVATLTSTPYYASINTSIQCFFYI